MLVQNQSQVSEFVQRAEIVVWQVCRCTAEDVVIARKSLAIVEILHGHSEEALSVQDAPCFSIDSTRHPQDRGKRVRCWHRRVVTILG